MPGGRGGDDVLAEVNQTEYGMRHDEQVSFREGPPRVTVDQNAFKSRKESLITKPRHPSLSIQETKAGRPQALLSRTFLTLWQGLIGPAVLPN